MEYWEAQRCTQVIAGSAACVTEALGYLSANLERLKNNDPLRYTAEDFQRLIGEHGVDVNSVISQLFHT